MERPFAPSRSRGSGLINHDHDVYDYYDDFDEIFCDLFIIKCSVRSLPLQRSATLDMMPLLWCCLFNEHVYILAKRGWFVCRKFISLQTYASRNKNCRLSYPYLLMLWHAWNMSAVSLCFTFKVWEIWLRLSDVTPSRSFSFPKVLNCHLWDLEDGGLQYSCRTDVIFICIEEVKSKVTPLPAYVA